MSYYLVEAPRRERIALYTALVAAFGLLVVAMLAGMSAARPLRLVIDGERVEVPAGTTVRDLQDANELRARAGDLLGIDGSVVATGGGEPPTLLRNGRPARPTQRLYSGDRLVSSPGSSRRESIEVTEVPIPYETRYMGTGSLTELSVLGGPGVRRVTRGAVSGIEVTSTIMRAPTDMVIARVRPTGGKLVALTFDDGPWPGSTAQVLAVLKREQVPATFFMVGKQVTRHKDLARRVLAEGHDIGSHTNGHVSLAAVSPARGRAEIRAGKRVIEQVTGHSTTWMRPPYGAMDSDAWQQVRVTKMRVVLWDVDSRDWTRPGYKAIENSVVRDVRPGSIVLFHDGGGDRRQTVWALTGIIRRLKAQGYTFVTVDELVGAKAAAVKANTPGPAIKGGS